MDVPSRRTATILFPHRIVSPFALVCAWLSSCSTPPEPTPVVPPALQVGVRHVAGTVLSDGPIDGIPRLEAGKARRVRCRVTYLRRMPVDDLVPLATRTRLVVAAHGSEPLVPAAALISSARVGAGNAAAAFATRASGDPIDAVEIAGLSGVLHAGTTAGFRALGPPQDRGVQRRRAEILVSEDAEGRPVVALQIDDLANTASQRLLRRQVVLLEDVPTEGEAPLVLVFPSVYDDGGAFLAEITIDRPGDALTPILARARADLEQASALGESPRFGGTASTNLTLATSLKSLDISRHQRPSLVFLAQSTGATLALDLAMTADNATLAAWVLRVGPDVIEHWRDAKATPIELGWRLEHTAFTLLAARLDKDDLTTEMRGVLAMHAGEAGRFPGILSGALRRCGSNAQLHETLMQENREFLVGSDPAARVRAFDWLRARDAAPPGFDPLAPRTERRKALAAAEAAARIEAQTGPKSSPKGDGR